MPTSRPQIIIVMGVAGAGKSTIGRALANRLGWTFLDADDFHPPANVEKMRRGVALTDRDRRVWLDRLHQVIGEQLAAAEPTVLACSALKEVYRRRLAAGHEGLAFVFLRASRSVIEERLGSRTGHFFSAELLDSQFATLEVPATAIVVDASKPANDIVRDVLAEIEGA